MSEQRSMSMYEYAILYDFAESKFSSIQEEETRMCVMKQKRFIQCTTKWAICEKGNINI